MSKNIIITGGELFNKGAQSMTFITIDQMKRKYPDAEIIVLSTKDYERSIEDKRQYNFKILPFTSGWIYEFFNGATKVLWSLKNKIKPSKYDKYEKEKIELKNLLKDTEYMIDVSGFAFSSQFSFNRSLDFLLRIYLAKHYKIPMIVMPQSFGPFDFKGKNKYIIDFLAKRTLSYPVAIYAREPEGYNLLKSKYNLDNVYNVTDMVLLNENINYENIYVNNIEPTLDIDIKNGVGIVPNKENFSRGTDVLDVYVKIIDTVLEQGKTVYVVRHSFDDKQACEIIKNEYSDNENVVLLNDDVSSREFDLLLDKFDFIVGSRFHSIIHAYKKNVPVIAIGWATKYHVILDKFEQGEYMFDVRETISLQLVEDQTNKMLNNLDNESTLIEVRLNEIKHSVDLFSVFK